MNFEVTVGLNAEALSTIKDLVAAIRGIGAGATQVNVAPVKVTSTTTATQITEVEEGPFYWANNETGFFGQVETIAEYNKLKKKDAGVYRIPASQHEEKVKELRATNEAAAAEKKAAAAEKKAAAAEKPAAKAAAKPAVKKEAAAPSLDDLIAVFSSYLPKDLDKDERAKRAEFVKPMLARFGAAKATELPEENRALAINLVQRKMAGEDVDPTTAEFAEVGAEVEEDDLV